MESQNKAGKPANCGWKRNKTAPDTCGESSEVGKKEANSDDIEIGGDGIELCDELFKQDVRPYKLRKYSLYHIQVNTIYLLHNGHVLDSFKLIINIFHATIYK